MSTAASVATSAGPEFRYSDLLTMWQEQNTATNFPAQIELYSTAQGEKGPEGKFLFMAKGGGSANRSFLFQETKAVLGNDLFSKSSGAVTVSITALRVRSGE